MSTIILIGIVWLLMINTVTVEAKAWSDYLLLGTHKYEMGSPKNISKSYIITKEINPWRNAKEDCIKNHQSINFYNHRKQPVKIDKSVSKPIVNLALESKTLSGTLKPEDNDLYMRKHKRRCSTGYYNFKLDLCEQRPLKLKSFIRSDFSSRNKKVFDNNKDLSFTKMTNRYTRPIEKAKNKKLKFSFQWDKGKEYLFKPTINIENSHPNQFHEEEYGYHKSSTRLQPHKYLRTNFKSPFGISDEQESKFLKDFSNMHEGKRLNYHNKIVIDDGTYKGNEFPSPEIGKDISKAIHKHPSKEYMLQYDSTPVMKSHSMQNNKNQDVKNSILLSSGDEYKLSNINALRKSKNSKFIPKNSNYYFYNYKTNKQNFNQYKGLPDSYKYTSRRHIQENFNPLNNFGYGSLQNRNKGIAKIKVDNEPEHKNLFHQYVNEINAINRQGKFNVLENKVMNKDQHSPGEEHEGTIAGKLITGLLHSKGSLSIPALNGLSENQVTEGLVEGPMTPAYDDTYPDSMSFDYSPQDFDLSQAFAQGNRELTSNSSEMFENPIVAHNLKIKHSAIKEKPDVGKLTSDNHVHNEALHAQLSGDVTYMPHDEMQIRVKQFMETNFPKLELEVSHDIPIFNQSNNKQDHETSVSTEENRNTNGKSEEESTVFGHKGNTDFVAEYTERISAENTTVFDNSSITEEINPHDEEEESNVATTELSQEYTANTTVENIDSNTENNSPLTIGSTNAITVCPTNNADAISSAQDKVYFVITGTLYKKKLPDKNRTESCEKDTDLSKTDSEESNNKTINSNKTMLVEYENTVKNSVTTPLTMHDEKNTVKKVNLLNSINNKKSEKLSHSAFMSDLQQNQNLQRTKKHSSVLNFPTKHISPRNSINDNKIKNILLLKSHIMQENVRLFKKKKCAEKSVYKPPLKQSVNFNEASLTDNNVNNEILNAPLNSNLKSYVGLETAIKSMDVDKVFTNDLKKRNTDKSNIQNNTKENVLKFKNEYESTKNNLLPRTNNEIFNNKQVILDTDFDISKPIEEHNSEEISEKSIKILKQQTVAPFKFDPQYYNEIYDVGIRSAIKKEIQTNQNDNQVENIENTEREKTDINNEKYKTFQLQLPYIFNELLTHFLNGKIADSAVVNVEFEPESQERNVSQHRSSQIVLKFNNEIPKRYLDDQRDLTFKQQTNTSNDSHKQIISSISDKLSHTINVPANENKIQFYSDNSEAIHTEKTFSHSTAMDQENIIDNSNKDKVAYVLPKKTVDNYEELIDKSLKPVNIKITIWPQIHQPTLKLKTEGSQAAKGNGQFLPESETKEQTEIKDLKGTMFPANSQLSTEKHSSPQYISINIYPPQLSVNGRIYANKEKGYDSSHDNSYNLQDEKQQIWRKRNILSTEESNHHDENGDAIMNSNDRSTLIGQLNAVSNKVNTIKYGLFQDVRQGDNVSCLISSILLYPPPNLNGLDDLDDSILIKIALTSVKQHFVIIKNSKFYFSCVGVENLYDTSSSMGHCIKVIFSKISIRHCKKIKSQIYTRSKGILIPNKTKVRKEAFISQNEVKQFQVSNQFRLKHLEHKTFLCPCQYPGQYMFTQMNHPVYTKQKSNIINFNNKLRTLGSSICINKMNNLKNNINNKSYAIINTYSQNMKCITSNSHVPKYKILHKRIAQKSHNRLFNVKLDLVNGNLPIKELGSYKTLLNKTFNMAVQGDMFEIHHSPNFMYHNHFCSNSQAGPVQQHKCFFKYKFRIKHTTNTGIKYINIKPETMRAHKIMKKHIKVNKNCTSLCYLNKWHKKKSRKKHQICSNKHSKELSNPKLSTTKTNFIMVIKIRNIYPKHRIVNLRVKNNAFQRSWKNEIIKNAMSPHFLIEHKSKHSHHNMPPTRLINSKKYGNMGKRERIHIRKLHAFFEQPKMKQNYLKNPQKIYLFPNNTKIKNFLSVFTHYLPLNSSTLNAVVNNSKYTHFNDKPPVNQYGRLYGSFMKNNLIYLKQQKFLNLLEKKYVDDSITFDISVLNHTNINKNPSLLITVSKMENVTQNPVNPAMSLQVDDLKEIPNTGQPLSVSNQSILPLILKNRLLHYINVDKWENTHNSNFHALPITRNRRSIKNYMDDQSFSKPHFQNDIEHKLTHLNKFFIHPDIINFSENKIKYYYSRYPSIVDYLQRLKHKQQYNHNRNFNHLKLLHGKAVKNEKIPEDKDRNINFSPKIHNKNEDTVLVRNSKRKVVSSAQLSVSNDSFTSTPNFLNKLVGIKYLINVANDLTTEFGSNWINERHTGKRICRNLYNCNQKSYQTPLKYDDNKNYVRMQPELEEEKVKSIEIPYLEQSNQMQIERPYLRNESTLQTELQIPVQEEVNKFVLGNFDVLEQIGKTEDPKNFNDYYSNKYVPNFENTQHFVTISYDNTHNDSFMQLSSVTKQSWTTEHNHSMTTSVTGTETFATIPSETTSVQEVTNEISVNTEDTTTQNVDTSTYLSTVNGSSIDFLSVIKIQSTPENTDSDSDTVVATVQVTNHSSFLLKQNFTTTELVSESEKSEDIESTVKSTTHTSSPQSIETESITISSQYTEIESSLGPESESSLQVNELETFQESETPLIMSQVTETVHDVTASLQPNETEPINLLEKSTSKSTIAATIIKSDHSIDYTKTQINTISSSVEKITNTGQIFEEAELTQNQTKDVNNKLITPLYSVNHFKTIHTENNQGQISETNYISVKPQLIANESVHGTGEVTADLNMISTESSLTTKEDQRTATVTDETSILKETEPSTQIEELGTAPVTHIKLAPNYGINITSHSNSVLNTSNHSEQSTTTNNTTMQDTEHCEIKDYSCHCALTLMVDEFDFLASNKLNFSSYLNHYQCKAMSFKETELMLSDFNIHTDLHNTTDNFVEGKLKAINYAELVLNYSTNNFSDDANLTVLIGSNVEIECTRSTDIFSLGQGSISFNWKFSAANVFNENIGGPISGQELSLTKVSLKDEGTYTCEVQSEEQENDDVAQFSHQVSVVGLPLYIIKIKMTYLRSRQCEEDDLILVKQLNSMLNNIVCGKICVIWIPEIKCVNEGNVSLQYVTIFCDIKHLYEMIPSLNNIKCDIQCSSYLDTIFLVGVQHNLQYLLTIPVSYRSSNSLVNIVPLLKMFNVTLLQGCGLGYGLYQNLCVPCPPQFYGPSDTFNCKPCEKGTYQPEKGSELCIPCPHPFAATTCHILVQERYSYIAAVCIFGILILTTICCCSIAIYLRCKQKKNKTTSESPGYFTYATDSSFPKAETVPLLPAKEENEFLDLHSAVQIEDETVKDDISIFMEENREKIHSHIVSYHIASEIDSIHNSPGMVKFKTRKRRPPLPPLDF